MYPRSLFKIKQVLILYDSSSCGENINTRSAPITSCFCNSLFIHKLRYQPAWWTRSSQSWGIVIWSSTLLSELINIVMDAWKDWDSRPEGLSEQHAGWWGMRNKNNHKWDKYTVYRFRQVKIQLPEMRSKRKETNNRVILDWSTGWTSRIIFAQVLRNGHFCIRLQRRYESTKKYPHSGALRCVK